MIVLNEKKILPYYKIEKTIEGKEFFYSHIGYFNFWDDLLVLHTKESDGMYLVLVDRGNYKEKYRFGNYKATEKQKLGFCNAIATSVYFKKPEEMFEDFPEINRLF